VDRNQDIFDPVYVKGVFDRCGPNYRIWSQIASFGFVWLWRKQCIDQLPVGTGEGKVVWDLMAGTGETWPMLLQRYPKLAHITAVDISSSMVQRAIERLHRQRHNRIDVKEANILEERLPQASADFIVCTFGLKTFNQEQQTIIAEQVANALKPGGQCCFIEASDPHGWFLRPLYRFYMDRFLPLIEKVFLKGAQDFAMIGAYSTAFKDCGFFAEALRKHGLDVSLRQHVFGCATSVAGRKKSL
jgi:ubiquinone/menaquinone biosynthesis C-methylase UbiE